MDKRFVLDTNILVYCHRIIYPFDMAPAFWRQLVEKGGQKIILIDKVKEEILRNEDQLSDWLKENENNFTIVEVGKLSVIECYSKIITSVKENQQYKETAKAQFAEVADSWLCAYGMSSGDIIVTEEKYEPDSKKSVKIPNVCREFSIDYIGLLEFMRKLDIRFD
ncbi:MAG TPA: DUF4411 family protein [Syntrophomonadaceae bacterium]|nr:DUF4411 family protein [Syntrophomonadaceae bacterium]